MNFVTYNSSLSGTIPSNNVLGNNQSPYTQFCQLVKREISMAKNLRKQFRQNTINLTNNLSCGNSLCSHANPLRLVRAFECKIDNTYERLSASIRINLVCILQIVASVHRVPEGLDDIMEVSNEYERLFRRKRVFPLLDERPYDLNDDCSGSDSDDSEDGCYQSRRLNRLFLVEPWWIFRLPVIFPFMLNSSETDFEFMVKQNPSLVAEFSTYFRYLDLPNLLCPIMSLNADDMLKTMGCGKILAEEDYAMEKLKPMPKSDTISECLISIGRTCNFPIRSPSNPNWIMKCVNTMLTSYGSSLEVEQKGNYLSNSEVDTFKRFHSGRAHYSSWDHLYLCRKHGIPYQEVNQLACHPLVSTEYTVCETSESSLLKSVAHYTVIPGPGSMDDVKKVGEMFETISSYTLEGDKDDILIEDGPYQGINIIIIVDGLAIVTRDIIHGYNTIEYGNWKVKEMKLINTKSDRNCSEYPGGSYNGKTMLLKIQQVGGSAHKSLSVNKFCLIIKPRF